MGSVTTVGLSVSQLRELANDPAATLAQLPAVLASLSSSEEEIVNWAAEALENCGPPEPSSLSVLERFIIDQHADVAAWACKLAARMEQAAAPAQAQLAAALESGKSLLVREEAARALGMIGPLQTTTTNLLEQAAKDGSPRLKRLATAALGQ